MLVNNSKGILAITICILTSCRSPSESNYSLLNYDRPFLGKIIGDECSDAGEGATADVYRIGLAGKLTYDVQQECQSSS